MQVTAQKFPMTESRTGIVCWCQLSINFQAFPPVVRSLGLDAQTVLFSSSMVLRKETVGACFGTDAKYLPNIAKISDEKSIFTTMGKLYWQ